LGVHLRWVDPWTLIWTLGSGLIGSGSLTTTRTTTRKAPSVEARLPAYLSPSRLSTYDRCPKLFHERYVLKLEDTPTMEMAFGTAIHRGIEAHYRGQDDEIAFLAEWRAARRKLSLGNHLDDRGLELLDMVRSLNLAGQPERKFIYAYAGFSVPFLGIIDLWGKGVIRDFKTTGYGWTQKRADDELFQPAVYAQAYASESGGKLPEFEYIVLPRVAGPMQRWCGCRSRQQIDAAFERIMDIHLAIEAQEFDCTCNGRYHEERAA
jgi:hypothetical protein